MLVYPGVLHRYCTFCPPLFSSFRCRLLVAPLGVSPSAPCPERPAIPCLTLPKVLYANHTEYNGIATHIHHALFPKTLARNVVPQDQYSTSNMYSVNPLASRSWPEFFTSPLGPLVGLPIFSNQNSIANAGDERKTHSRNVGRVLDDRNSRKRSRMKRALKVNESK